MEKKYEGAYEDKEVLRFIIAAINKGKVPTKTKGMNLFTTGLFHALRMFRSKVKNPLLFVRHFVQTDRLLVRPAGGSSLHVYDPANVSDQVRKKCIQCVKVLIDENQENNPGYNDRAHLLVNAFSLSEVGHLSAVNGEIIIACFPDDTNSYENAPVGISGITRTKRSDVLYYFLVKPHKSSFCVRYSIKMPSHVDEGEFVEALESAAAIYNRVMSSESSGTDYRKEQAQKLYGLVLSLIGDAAEGAADDFAGPEALAEAEKMLNDFFDIRRDHVASQEDYKNAKKRLREMEDEVNEKAGKMEDDARNFKMIVRDMQELMQQHPALKGVLGAVLSQYKM